MYAKYICLIFELRLKAVTIKNIGKPQKKVFFNDRAIRPFYPSPASLMAVGTFFLFIKSSFFLNGRPAPSLNGTAIKKNDFLGLP